MTGSKWQAQANQIADERNFIRSNGVYALDTISDLGELGKTKSE